MNQLTYLMEEICAGVEIYYTGKQGGQYLKTAFILCDDYTELTSKLFLLHTNPNWSDKNSNGRFKNYHAVLGEVKNNFNSNSSEYSQIDEIQNRMKERRTRRNNFFHSTHLLNLNIYQRDCIEAYLDLFCYGEILFSTDWKNALEASRNIDSFLLLLQLEQKSFSDPSLMYQVDDILRQWKCNKNRLPHNPKGCHVTSHPEDVYLRLCIIYGGQELRDKLTALLP